MNAGLPDKRKFAGNFQTNKIELLCSLCTRLYTIPRPPPGHAKQIGKGLTTHRFEITFISILIFVYFFLPSFHTPSRAASRYICRNTHAWSFHRCWMWMGLYGATTIPYHHRRCDRISSSVYRILTIYLLFPSPIWLYFSSMARSVEMRRSILVVII